MLIAITAMIFAAEATKHGLKIYFQVLPLN